MANVRSKRLLNAQLITTGATASYTAPPGETSLLKTITIARPNPAAVPPVTMTVLLILFPTTGSAINLRRWTPLNQQLFFESTWLVLQPGDRVEFSVFFTGGGESMQVGLFGAELEGVAE